MVENDCNNTQGNDVSKVLRALVLVFLIRKQQIFHSSRMKLMEVLLYDIELTSIDLERPLPSI